MTSFYIYGLSSSQNPDLIRYIGYSVNINDRLNEHLRDINRSFVHTHKKFWLKKEINNGNNILTTILDEAISMEDAKNKEINYLKLFKSLGAKLVNGTQGGDGVKATEEVKRKISEKTKGRNISEDVRNKISASHKGKKLSFAHKQKINLANQNRCGRIWTDAERLKLSNSLKGRVSPRKGKKLAPLHAEFTRKLRVGAISERRIPIIQYTLQGGFIREWDFISMAKKETKIKNIDKCLKGKRSHAGKFIWKYKNNTQ